MIAVLSSQFSVLSSRFSVLSSQFWFSVLGSQFSVRVPLHRSHSGARKILNAHSMCKDHNVQRSSDAILFLEEMRGPVLPRFDRMAQGCPVRHGGLQSHQGISARRTVRSYEPAPQGRGFGAQQHRGRASQILLQGVQSLSQSCAGFIGRNRDSIDHRPELELSDTEAEPVAARSCCGIGPCPERLARITKIHSVELARRELARFCI
jgi:hypothetical protein